MARRNELGARLAAPAGEAEIDSHIRNAFLIAAEYRDTGLFRKLLRKPTQVTIGTGRDVGSQ